MVYKCDICDTQADDQQECCGQEMLKFLNEDELKEYAEIMGVNDEDDMYD